MKKTASLFIAIACFVGIAFGQRYELVVLDDGTNETAAYGINSYGYSSGYVSKNGKLVPCLWSPAGGTYELPVPNGVTWKGNAFSISDDFIVAGTFSFGPTTDTWAGDGHGYIWQFNLVTSEFVPSKITSALGSTARSINNAGLVVGSQGYQAFVHNTHMSVKTSLTNDDSCLFAINANGHATGTYYGPSVSGGANYYPIFVRSNADGTRTTVAGHLFGGYNAKGMALNNSNQIVGVSRQLVPYGTIVENGLYWEPETGVVASFPNGSRCFGINDAGTIIGDLNGKATYWRKKNGIFASTDLNSVVNETRYTMTHAYGINAKGQIVGQCIDKETGVKKAYILTPTTTSHPRLSKTSASEMTLSWESKIDHVYRIKLSTDLKTWETVPGYYWADNTNSFVYVGANEPQLFIVVLDLTPD